MRASAVYKNHNYCLHVSWVITLLIIKYIPMLLRHLGIFITLVIALVTISVKFALISSNETNKSNLQTGAKPQPN